jgi:prepilin-type N-terminal cleavage/methylation domain-containing protein
MAANRAGFTLVELLIGLVVAAIIGASLVQLMAVQSQFFNRQEGRSNARAVARSATNMLMAELRMIETSGGIAAATPDSVTVRVPTVFGVSCGLSAGGTTLALLPVDSAFAANGAPSGVAVRTAGGTYAYDDSGYTLTPGTAATCAAGSITPFPGGSVRNIGQSIPAPGTIVFLYSLVTYRFAESTAFPGERALWRRVPGLALHEELVAPFDSTARFRFYVGGSAVPQDAPPADLTTLRGLELRLVGVNDRTGVRDDAERAPLTTAVFFRNSP